MLITQLKAIRLVRESTGLSILASTELVRGLPKKRDGKRDKVYAQDVRKAITATNVRTPDPVVKLTKRNLERLAEIRA